MCNALNLTIAHDFDCLKNGDSNLPRHTSKAYGDGAFCQLPMIDGSGTFLANTILWKRNENGKYRVLRFEDMGRDHNPGT